MSIAATLLAGFRAAAPIQNASPARTNSKLPIAECDQKAVRAKIRKDCPEWMALFHELSLVTGWRTNDVCALTFSAVDIVCVVFASAVMSKLQRSRRSQRIMQRIGGSILIALGARLAFQDR